jgi:hypothetical protein
MGYEYPSEFTYAPDFHEGGRLLFSTKKVYHCHAGHILIRMSCSLHYDDLQSSSDPHYPTTSLSLSKAAHCKVYGIEVDVGG